MAKANGLTAIDRYIEKAVTAACALVLVYALFEWGFSSPMEFVSKDGEKMPPAKIDGWLKSQAERAQSKVDDFRPPGTLVPNYIKALTDISMNASGEKYMLAFDLTDARAPLKVEAPPRKETITLAELQASMPAPQDKPLVKAAWVLPQKDNATDICVVDGVIAYPYTDLIKQWNDKFHTSLNVIFAEQVVEVQEQNPDGSWGSASQAKLQPSASIGSASSALVVPQLPAYDGKNAQEVQASLNLLASDEYQQLILQPDYPAVYWARPSQWVSWRVNLPPSELSDGVVQVQGTPIEISTAALAPSATVGGAAAIVAPAAPPVAVPAAPVAPPPVARPPPAPAGPGGPGGPGAVYRPPEAMMGGGVNPEAERLARRRAAAPPSGGAAPAQAPAPTPAPTPTPMPTPAPTPGGLTPPGGLAPTAVPPINPLLPSMSTEPAYITQRDDKGRILAWFSDSSIQGGKTYRFRVRFKLANPLLTSDNEVKDPQDARKPFIYSPWSQWSTPVSAPDSARIFLSGASMASAQVTIFTKVFGQVVKQVGGVLPGDAIGHEEDVKVANPFALRMEQKKVNFGTGCVAVAINFDKSVYRGSVLKKTMELVYLDADGQLQSRLQDADRDSKLYKELLDLSTPPAAGAVPGGPAVVPGR